MTRQRLFVGKSARPDITKPISDRIYYGEYMLSPGSGEEKSAYPGLSLKGCSKDGSDGKEGSDGQENIRDTFELDEPDLESVQFVNLSEQFRPQLVGANPGPAIRISTTE
jgi:hypothetical protein